MKYTFKVTKEVTITMPKLRDMALPDDLTWSDISITEVKTMLEDMLDDHSAWLEAQVPVRIYTGTGAREALPGTQVTFALCSDWLMDETTIEERPNHFIVDERGTMNTPERVTQSMPYTLKAGVDIDIFTPRQWQETTNHG